MTEVPLFPRLLRRYGRLLTVHNADGTTLEVLGFLRSLPIPRGDGVAEQPTPLGVVSQARFLLFSDPKLALKVGGTLSCGGVVYEILETKPVYGPTAPSHRQSRLKAVLL
ncbi:MAG: hypothetical protein RR450_06095 [Oscillospiraceae bacterium]